MRAHIGGSPLQAPRSPTILVHRARCRAAQRVEWHRRTMAQHDSVRAANLLERASRRFLGHEGEEPPRVVDQDLVDRGLFHPRRA